MGDTQIVTFLEDTFDSHPNCLNGWSEGYAQIIVKAALTKLMYEGNDVVFTKYACKAIEEGNSRTEVCYLETEQPGFFYVMRDMADHVNVIYNRWD